MVPETRNQLSRIFAFSFTGSLAAASSLIATSLVEIVAMSIAASKAPPAVQQAWTHVMSCSDVANARARLLALGHDPQLLGDAPPAAAFATGDDLDHTVCHTP